jgi:hypothetical protein
MLGEGRTLQTPAPGCPNVAEKRTYNPLSVRITGLAALPTRSTQSSTDDPSSIHSHGSMHLHHTLREPSHALAKLTAYLTVYDSLFLKYRMEVMVHKRYKNRLSLGSQGGVDGFRGRVSQVRILPGPLVCGAHVTPILPVESTLKL